MKKLVGLALLILLIPAFLSLSAKDTSSVVVAGFVNLGGHENDFMNVMLSTMLIDLLNGGGVQVSSFNSVSEIEKSYGFWTNNAYNPLTAVSITEDLKATICVTGSYLVLKDSIYFNLQVYDIWAHKLVLQRTYRGMPTKELFYTIDGIARDIVLMVRGKAADLGFVKIKVLSMDRRYRVYLNGNNVSLVDSSMTYQGSFLAGQTIKVSLRDAAGTKEFYSRDLEVRKGRTNEIVYSPTSSALFHAGRSGVMVILDGTNVGLTDDKGELHLTGLKPGEDRYFSMIWNGREYANGKMELNEEQLSTVTIARMVSSVPGPKFDAGLVIPFGSTFDLTENAGVWPGFVIGAGITAGVRFLDDGFLAIRVHGLFSLDTYYPDERVFASGSTIESWNFRFGADALFHFLKYFYAGPGADFVYTVSGRYGTPGRKIEMSPEMLGMDVYLTGTAGFEYPLIAGRLYLPIELRAAYSLTVPNARVLDIGIKLSLNYRFGPDRIAEGLNGFHRN